jgi:hypothetical protein
MLRAHAPNIPVTHFICPAYFTSGIRKADERIKRVIRDMDEVALHVHCYKSLIDYSGIAFRVAENYYNRWVSKLIGHLPKPLQHTLNQHLVSGRGVPLGVYNNEEIRKIIKDSALILKSHLHPDKISGFRAGGWLLRDDVFTILHEVGMSYDSSAVPPETMSQGYSLHAEGNNLDDYGQTYGHFTELIKRLWGGRLETGGFLQNRKIRTVTRSQPITKVTSPFSINGIFEMPNNGSLSDFASTNKTLIPLFEKLLGLCEKESKPVFLNFGCHQEGPATYKLETVEFLKYLEPYKKEITFMTVAQAANIAREIVN